MNENTQPEPENMAASGSPCSAWLGRGGLPLPDRLHLLLLNDSGTLSREEREAVKEARDALTALERGEMRAENERLRQTVLAQADLIARYHREAVRRAP